MLIILTEILQLKAKFEICAQDLLSYHKFKFVTTNLRKFGENSCREDVLHSLQSLTLQV